MVKYYVKTEKGYFGGKVSGDTYEMEKRQLAGGTHTTISDMKK